MPSSSPKDVLEEIFTRAASNSGVFSNREVLRADYVPEKLPFREEQINNIGEILAPIIRSSKPSNLLLYGKTGTGKTAVVKHVLKRLQDATSSKGLPIATSYCNTRVCGTEYRLLTTIGEAIDVDIPFTGLALNEVSQRLFSQIETLKLNVIITLDEIDYLVKHSGDDVLYEFTRSGERLKGGTITIIGISNDLNFKELLDPRVLSSLGEEEIVFPPYTVDELRTILKERSKVAFRDGTCHDAAINLCAAIAGTEHGDARRAVDILRVAGEVAERAGAKSIEEGHIRLAVQKIEQDRITQVLRSLPLHEKLILLGLILEGSTESTGVIYSHYSNLCKRLGVEQLTQRRVSGLISELDLLGLINTNLMNKGRYGRTKKITLIIGEQVARQILAEDPLMGSLFSLQ